MPDITRMLPSTCHRCGVTLDGATGISGAERPTEGAVAICWCCGTVAFFTANLTLREPTVDEVRDLLDDAHIRAALESLYEHHLARIADDVDGGGVKFKCGCRTTSGGALFTLRPCAENCAAGQMVLRRMEANGKPISVLR